MYSRTTVPLHLDSGQEESSFTLGPMQVDLPT